MLRFIFSSIILITLGFVIVYFLPTSYKLKGMESLSGFIPASVKAKTEELLLSAPEKRAKLIQTLEDNFSELEEYATSSAAVRSLLRKSDELLAQLKNKNSEQSFTEIIKTELVKTFLADKNATSTACLK